MGGSSGGGVPPWAAASAKKAQGLIPNLAGQGLGGQYLPKFQNIATGQANLASPGRSPSALGVIRGAQQGAGYGGKTASDIFGFSQGLVPYAQQIGQMGFDPQKELYNRTLQQVQDQQRAGQAARGISMSPYGAGLEGDATRNFNIDWQNQALKRATDAATSMEGLGSSAFNLGSGATDLAAASRKLPYQAQQGLMQDKAGAYAGVGSQVGAANQPLQQAISDYLGQAGMGANYANAAANQQNADTGALGTIGKLVLSTIAK